GSIADATSLLAGMPRSASWISFASVLLISQLMSATDSSGCAVRAETDHSTDALYQAFRSTASPAMLGKRRNGNSLPAAASTASSWFDHHIDIAVLPVTNMLWSSGTEESSVICEGLGIAPASANCWWYSSQVTMSSTVNPGSLPGTNSSLPCWRSQPLSIESLEMKVDVPMTSPPEASLIDVASSSQSSHVHVVSSGISMPSSSSTSACTMITGVLMPALTP